MESEIKHLENLIARKVELVKALQDAILTKNASSEWVLRNEIEELDAVIAKHSYPQCNEDSSSS